MHDRFRRILTRLQAAFTRETVICPLVFVSLVQRKTETEGERERERERERGKRGKKKGGKGTRWKNFGERKKKNEGKEIRTARRRNCVEESTWAVLEV